MSLNSNTTIYPFLEDVINCPFGISVRFCISTPIIYEPAHPMEEDDIPDISDDEDEYTPPDETYRQDRCVVCLDSNPNILYLECNHIAVCDSCDRMKRTKRLRRYCDICRAEISSRIAL